MLHTHSATKRKFILKFLIKKDCRFSILLISQFTNLQVSSKWQVSPIRRYTYKYDKRSTHQMFRIPITMSFLQFNFKPQWSPVTRNFLSWAYPWSRMLSRNTFIINDGYRRTCLVKANSVAPPKKRKIEYLTPS